MGLVSWRAHWQPLGWRPSGHMRVTTGPRFCWNHRFSLCWCSRSELKPPSLGELLQAWVVRGGIVGWGRFIFFMRKERGEKIKSHSLSDSDYWLQFYFFALAARELQANMALSLLKWLLISNCATSYVPLHHHLSLRKASLLWSRVAFYPGVYAFMPWVLAVTSSDELHDTENSISVYPPKQLDRV